MRGRGSYPVSSSKPLSLFPVCKPFIRKADTYFLKQAERVKELALTKLWESDV